MIKFVSLGKFIWKEKGVQKTSVPKETSSKSKHSRSLSFIKYAVGWTLVLVF